MVAFVCIFQFCVPVRILKCNSKDSGHALETMQFLFLRAVLQAEITAFDLFLLTLCPVCFNQGKVECMHAQLMSSAISRKQEVNSDRYCQALALCISTETLCFHENRAFSPSKSMLATAAYRSTVKSNVENLSCSQIQIHS